MQQPNPYANPQNFQPQPESQRGKRPGRARRIFRGYLMVAGALATLAGLTLLIVSLFVEINKWM